MGRWIYSLVLMGALVGLMACGDENANETAGTVAITPNNADCLYHGPNYTGNNVNCNPGQFNQMGQGFTQYQYQGNQYYGQQNNYNNGFCGCQGNPGYQPTYHSQYGLGCVQTTYATSAQYWSYNYGYDGYSMSQAALNINQTSYYSQPSNDGCYSALTYSCDTRQPNSCGGGGYCRPVGGASTAGVCTFGNGSNW